MLNIYIVGPSCGGKTTLLHYLHENLQSANIPRRYLTRLPRNGWDPLENGFLTNEEFQKKRREGRFYISWHRIFANQRKEYYGFLDSDVRGHDLNIFSGNNALLLYPESVQPSGALKNGNTLFVACTAPEEVRAQRLKERSPEYETSEVDVRIRGESIDHLHSTFGLVLDSSKYTSVDNGKRAIEFIELHRSQSAAS